MEIKMYRKLHSKTDVKLIKNELIVFSEWFNNNFSRVTEVLRGIWIFCQFTVELLEFHKNLLNYFWSYKIILNVHKLH